MIEAAAESRKDAPARQRPQRRGSSKLAYINDLYGNDDIALDYYRRCTDRPPVPLAAWVNLGILYEDDMRLSARPSSAIATCWR